MAHDDLFKLGLARHYPAVQEVIQKQEGQAFPFPQQIVAISFVLFL
uniref:Uncharacterized protein n=1 Tax=Arundo donax TaxID=35708 RepID=A0A0A9BWL8_ARUDO